MTTYTFHHLDLAGAEEELLGACIDDEIALLIAEELLPRPWPFRSREAHDLTLILACLLGWQQRGVFDGLLNRDRLADLYLIDSERKGRPEWESLLEGLWCPWHMVGDYVEDLCRQIAQAARLEAFKESADQAMVRDYPFRSSYLEEALLAELEAKRWARDRARDLTTTRQIVLPAPAWPPLAGPSIEELRAWPSRANGRR